MGHLLCGFFTYGWAIGDSATIIATSDGGESWIRQNSPSDSLYLERLQFIDKNVGYIVGRFGTILSTEDGGSTWIKLDSGYDFSYKGLSFISQDTGWVCGSDVFQDRRHGVILHTIDGGQTWHKQIETSAPDIFTTQLFEGIDFLDENNGWALAGDYVDNFSFTNVYRTSDGGQNWEVVGQIPAPMHQIMPNSIDSIWSAVYSLARSDDRGFNWEISYLPLTASIQDISLLDGRRGWVVAAKFENTYLFYTDDRGENWTDISPTNMPPARAISHFGEHFLWICGEAGVMMKYVEPKTFVHDNKKSRPLNFDIEQNFPNPFNAGTTIEFHLPKTSNAFVKVFDLQCRTIRILANRKFQAGSHGLVWDGKDDNGTMMPSGIYLCQLKSGSFSKLMKMTLLN